MISVRSAALGVSMAVWTVVAGATDITLAQVMQGLSLGDNTQIAVTKYWNSINGQQVTWSGEVVDFSTRRREARVFVADTSQPLYKGYNIMVKTYDYDKVSALKKGQTIRFTGELDEYKVQEAHIVITIARARLL
jgi:hypothetical protein